jgi:hypothetical protein
MDNSNANATIHSKSINPPSSNGSGKNTAGSGTGVSSSSRAQLRGIFPII